MGRRWWAQQDTAQVQSECQRDSESMGQREEEYPWGDCHQGLDHCLLWEQTQGDHGETV